MPFRALSQIRCKEFNVPFHNLYFMTCNLVTLMAFIVHGILPVWDRMQKTTSMQCENSTLCVFQAREKFSIAVWSVLGSWTEEKEWGIHTVWFNPANVCVLFLPVYFSFMFILWFLCYQDSPLQRKMNTRGFSRDLLKLHAKYFNIASNWRIRVWTFLDQLHD